MYRLGTGPSGLDKKPGENDNSEELQPERERLAETVKTIPFHTLALKVIEEEKSADREAARLSLKKM
ncbi:MAG: hypothetical protein ABL994_17545, partial [Verrucomicrobiales bacterium]